MNSPPISCIRKYSPTMPPTAAAFGDVSALPTAVFFYGMDSGQEINIDLERGKTLIVRYVTTSDPHEDGTRTVFFELNGQPRPIRVADRSQVAKRPPRRKVEAGNAGHVGAPMPGTIATVPVHVGQTLTKGEVLLTLEAMKMETTVRAERDGVIKEILAHARPAGGHQGFAAGLRVAGEPRKRAASLLALPPAR